MTVKEVLALGNTVKIVHLRRLACNGKPLQEPLHTHMQIKNTWSNVEPYNLGGETRVSVTTPTGQVLTGVARCSNRDNFNKKLGVQIALGRAMTSGE